MSVARKRRRADGSLRPSVRRYRLRKRAEGEPFVDPVEGDRFFGLALAGTHFWAGENLQQATGLSQVDLGAILERAADRARWVKLRDTAGSVRAIAVPRNHPARDATRSEQKKRMLEVVAALASLVRDRVALEHCWGVARAFEWYSDEALVAIYHDHLEDGTGDVPDAIRAHVEVLTRREGEEYDDYIARVKTSGDPVAIAVKVADLRYNLARCRGEHGGHLKPHLESRYERALPELELVLAG